MFLCNRVRRFTKSAHYWDRTTAAAASNCTSIIICARDGDRHERLSIYLPREMITGHAIFCRFHNLSVPWKMVAVHVVVMSNQTHNMQRY